MKHARARRKSCRIVVHGKTPRAQVLLPLALPKAVASDRRSLSSTRALLQCRVWLRRVSRLGSGVSRLGSGRAMQWCAAMPDGYEWSASSLNNRFRVVSAFSIAIFCHPPPACRRIARSDSALRRGHVLAARVVTVAGDTVRNRGTTSVPMFPKCLPCGFRSTRINGAEMIGGLREIRTHDFALGATFVASANDNFQLSLRSLDPQGAAVVTAKLRIFGSNPDCSAITSYANSLWGPGLAPQGPSNC